MKSTKLMFETSVIWDERTRGLLVAPNADDPIEVATPVEFPNGEEGPWSPEGLFLGAICSCFMGTFLSLAKRKDLCFLKFRCHAEGVVESVNGKLEFTEVKLFPEVYLMEEEQPSLGVEILLQTEKYCLITNSLKSKITVHTVIKTEKEFVFN